MNNESGPAIGLPEMATSKQVAAWLQVSHTTLKRLLRQRAIPVVRVGRQLRFPARAVYNAYVAGDCIQSERLSGPVGAILSKYGVR